MYNPRKDRIYKLEKKLDKLSERLVGNYRSASEMLTDFARFSTLEREIEIQKLYMNHEDNNG